MLFKRRVLDGIAAGTITLAFRRWTQPRVRAGSRIRTAVGVLAVETVDRVEDTAISDADARRAGYGSLEALHAALDTRGDGAVYRVALRLEGPDTREELRTRTDLSTAEMADLAKRLARLDKASRHGSWTMRVLHLIGARPGVRAADLASALGRETRAFKTDVRKLKELGLTESLKTGYRLSPRGRAVVERLGE